MVFTLAQRPVLLKTGTYAQRPVVLEARTLAQRPALLEAGAVSPRAGHRLLYKTCCTTPRKYISSHLEPCYYPTGPEGPHQKHASPEPRKARRLASTHARGLDEISACDGMGASKPPKSHHKMWTRDRMADFVALTLAQRSVLLEAGTFAQRPSAGTFAHGQFCWRLGP